MSGRAAWSTPPSAPTPAAPTPARSAASTLAAGVERRVTAHSGCVGLASELTSLGASTADVMLAGAGATAERGAVARYL